MIVKKSGIVRDIAESRLHEYTAKGYTPLVVLVEQEAPVAPPTKHTVEKRPKKPTAKE